MSNSWHATQPLAVSSTLVNRNSSVLLMNCKISFFDTKYAPSMRPIVAMMMS